MWLGHSQGLPGSPHSFIFTCPADADLLGLQKGQAVYLELASSSLKLSLCGRLFTWDLQRQRPGRAAAVPQHLLIKGRG